MRKLCKLLVSGKLYITVREAIARENSASVDTDQTRSMLHDGISTVGVEYEVEDKIYYIRAMVHISCLSVF